MPRCNFLIGRDFEKVAADRILIDAELFTPKNANYEFDLKWKGFKINVKAARLAKHGKKNPPSFMFRTHDHWKTCDYFLLIGYGKGLYRRRTIAGIRLEEIEDAILRVWLVPSRECQKECVNLSLKGNRSKYTQYEFKGNFLDQAAS